MIMKIMINHHRNPAKIKSQNKFKHKIKKQINTFYLHNDNVT